MAAKKKSPHAAAMARFEAKFTKDHGEGHIRAGETVPYGVPTISTGSLLVDYKLGTGGLPVGRSSELWGVPGSCKTTTGLLTIANAQRQYPDEYVCFVDVEGSFDRRWAEAHGVQMDQLKLIDDFKFAEEYCDAIFDAAQQSFFSMIMMDSIGALIPREEFEKKADQATVGTKAKLVTRLVHQLAPLARQNRFAMIYVNQIRALISAMGGSTTGGGFGLKHVSSVQIKHTEGAPKQVKVDGEMTTVGKEVAMKAEKNKLAPPKMIARPTFYQQTSRLGPVGIDLAAETFQLAKLLGLLERAGASYTFPSGEKVVGEEKATLYLRNTPEEMADIRERVLASVADQRFDPEAELAEQVAVESDLDLDQLAAETVGAA